MADSQPVVFALVQDENGRWHETDPTRLGDLEHARTWVHLDRSLPTARDCLDALAWMDPIVRDALLADETRPRAVADEQGVLLNLRGVNLNPGANPEDMVSLRMYATANRIVSTRSRPILAIDDVRSTLVDRGRKADVGDVVVMLAARLVDRVSGVIEALDDQADDLEDRLLSEDASDLRLSLTTVRRQSIILRRYLAPQREALARLAGDEAPVPGPEHRARIVEIQDRTLRFVEDLDAIRERAAIMQDELTTRLSDRLNRNMYLLTLISSIMLPLGFLTGLLGVNVDGMPGATDTPWAFAAVCVGMVVLVALEVALLRRLRWL